MRNAEEKYKILIETARSEKRRWEPFKYEEHHILPRCLGGTDEKTNLVLLTVREHFRAHILLADMYPDNGKLSLACIRMLDSREGLNLEDSETKFAELRLKAAKYISTIHKGRKKSDKERENIREARRKVAPRTFSEAARANMAQARKKTWAERKTNGTADDIISKTVAARKANGSYKHSEERRRQIGERQKGRTPWNKGVKGVSEETRAKMRESRRKYFEKVKSVVS
jgi:hypothetical protein